MLLDLFHVPANTVGSCLVGSVLIDPNVTLDHMTAKILKTAVRHLVATVAHVRNRKFKNIFGGD